MTIAPKDEVYVRQPPGFNRSAWCCLAVVREVRRDKLLVRKHGAGVRDERWVKASHCTPIKRSATSNAITRPFNTKTPQLSAVPKDPPVRDPRYLAWLREQPCARCGRPPRNEASHHPREGHGSTGMKCSDHRAITLCGVCHRTGVRSHANDPLDRDWVEAQIEHHRERYLSEVAA